MEFVSVEFKVTVGVRLCVCFGGGQASGSAVYCVGEVRIQIYRRAFEHTYNTAHLCLGPV